MAATKAELHRFLKGTLRINRAAGGTINRRRLTKPRVPKWGLPWHFECGCGRSSWVSDFQRGLDHIRYHRCYDGGDY